MRRTLFIVLLNLSLYCFGQADPELTLSSTFRKTYGDAAFTITATSLSPATIAYSKVDDPSSAISLSGNTITILGAGTASVKAEQAASEQYAAAEVTTTITVNKRFLYVNPLNTSRIYGDANPVFILTFGNFGYDDNVQDLNQVPFGITDATQTSAAGEYEISVATEPHPNYFYVTSKAVLTITRRPLDATADNISRVYGDANPPLTISYSGWANDDNVSQIDVQPSSSCSASESSPTGSYPIVVSGGSDNNYTIIPGNGLLTVEKRELEVRPASYTRLYGDSNPLFTLTFFNFANGEDLSVLDTPPQATTSAEYWSDAGEYQIFSTGGDDNNYSFKHYSSLLTIEKRELLAIAQDTARIYGDVLPSANIVFNGIMPWDEDTNIDQWPDIQYGGSVTQQTGTGTYTDAVCPSGGFDNNYFFDYQCADLVIRKADLLISGSYIYKEYGDELLVTTFDYQGLMTWDDPGYIDNPPLFSCFGTPAAAIVGTYPISFTTSGSDDNYNIATEDGMLEVTRAPLEIVMDTFKVEYGDPIPPIDYVITGLKLGHQPSDVFDSLPVFSTPARIGDVSDSYSIFMDSPGVLSNLNYSFDISQFELPPLVIFKAPLDMRIHTLNRLVQNPNPTLVYDWDPGDFKLSDNLATLGFSLNLKVDCDINSPAGEYEIFFEDGTDDPRYKVDVGAPVDSFKIILPPGIEGGDLSSGILRILPELQVGDLKEDSSCLYDRFDLSFNTDGWNLEYHWQIKQPGETDFYDLIDSDIYSGSTSETLVIDSMVKEMGNNLFICEVSMAFLVDSILGGKPEEFSVFSSEVQIGIKDTPPFAEIKPKGDNILVCTNNAVDSYQWGYDGVNIEGASGQYYVSPSPINKADLSSYYVIATYNNTCDSKTFCEMDGAYIFTPPDNYLGLDVWPNPSDGVLEYSISNLEANEKVNIVVTRHDGSPAINRVIYPPGSYYENRLVISNSGPGYYFLTVLQGDNLSTKTIIVTE